MGLSGRARESAEHAFRFPLQLASPLFPKITIHLGQRYGRGKDFVIEARNASADNLYIRKATLNGKPLTTFSFPAKALLKGGRLVLEMAAGTE